ncbi:RecE family exodeoxyribonuclease [Kluyvera ascorbata]|uniref:RecE family exodeoxyribonuclease n=1 Tax=Kluyvera ascorbata TaxID=51288 RepID=UPI002DBA3B94|nr:RecE family exodeoxyribonuclease [Kluyvera ascorbata]MEB6390627.1 PD-(D/E)XK nuclease-like domain-containing protein [Kluyvera ascorbata]
MEFFNVVKATQKSGKKDAVIWRSAKSEARANLQLDVDLEDAGIETGRGKDYQKPIRTDFPVFNDLPEEGVVDFTWCERYELAEDQRTWQLKPGAAPQDTFHQEDVADNDLTTELMGEENGDRKVEFSNDENAEFQLVTMPFRIQLLAQLCAEDGHVYHISIPRRKELSALEMDTDNTYVQNLLLAAENAPEVKTFDIPTLWKFTAAVKAVFPQDKRCEMSLVMRFVRIWIATDYIDRGLLVKEWQKGNRVPQIQRTDTGTNAGGGNKTDRNPDYEHTLDTLDEEIALATLPMDFDIYNIPGSIHRRAKEIVSKKESPFKEWSAALRKCAGILDYSRAAIFALIRGAAENVHHFPVSLQTYINANLTESKHDAPTAETVATAQIAPVANDEAISFDEVSKRLAAGRGEFVPGISDPTDPQWVHEDLTQTKQPEIANVGGGIFSIDGLMNAPAKPTEETTSDEQMEETERAEGEINNAVPAGEGAVEDDQQTDSVDAAAILAAAAPSLAADGQSLPEVDSAPKATPEAPEEPQTAPTAEYPAFFGPGRYEGLPNSVYHAANGVSSTQVKDARVSLMFYHGRHVTKTIRRESSDALTFGSLAHTLALEPEKLHEEFAVFPGIPAEAFTTTDSLKAFIRDYNTDKPKADQLKLTGKKEDLQEAIRAVKPDAIFADEFEQQWRDSVAGKIILTSEQLNLATAIQQALLNHESAGKLLRHPSRAVETSYFGMDEETGLEVRVRPDLEVEVNGVRIGVDLKTISMGRVKQEGLRAKLHREIIDRDYHISAGMYCNVADFDQFFWIFVNKDEGYHWVAVIEASEDLLDLGLLEYQRTMRALAQAYDTDSWPAPVTEDYTDELNDFDVRRLEALRLA